MFSIFQAHANKGALLMFSSGTYEGEVIGHFLGDDLYHASLAPEEYRHQLEKQGFTVIDYRENDPTCDRTIWLARFG